jgi:hypothetical protein
LLWCGESTSADIDGCSSLEDIADFGDDAAVPDAVRFVSVLTGPVRRRLPKMPFGFRPTMDGTSAS